MVSPQKCIYNLIDNEEPHYFFPFGFKKLEITAGSRQDLSKENLSKVLLEITKCVYLKCKDSLGERNSNKHFYAIYIASISVDKIKCFSIILSYFF